MIKRAIKPILLGTAALAVALAAPMPASADGGFYVATNGNDSWSGTLPIPNSGNSDGPFATPGRAQTAMQSSSIKTTYVRAGSFHASSIGNCLGAGSAAITLGSADNGETWSYYPPDGYNSAAIDGGKSLACAFDIEDASNITVNGLTIQNFVWQGITVSGGSNISVTNNIIQDIPAPIGQGGRTPFVAAIQFECSGTGSSWNGFTINHNVVLNYGQTGIRIDNGAAGPSQQACPGAIAPANTEIEYNFLQNNCMAFGDCGAIYLENVTPPASSPILIEFNYMKDPDPDNGTYFTSALNPTGVYFDGYVSNVALRGNIVAGDNLYSCYGIDGYGDVNMQYNICDFEKLNGAGYVVYDTAGATPAPSGEEVSFFNGIVVSNSSVAGNGLSSYEPLNAANNMYYGYGGASPSNGGDSAPMTRNNPNFTCGWTYSLAGGISSINFPAQPTNWGQPGFWGPPGFVVPHTGTTPSPPVSDCGKTASIQASASGTTIPDATEIVDTSGDVWTVGAGIAFEDATAEPMPVQSTGAGQSGGGSGSAGSGSSQQTVVVILLWWENKLYAETVSPDTWWEWAGTTWTDLGGLDEDPRFVNSQASQNSVSR